MLLTTLIANWYMIGVVCFVQVIAYPQFTRVGAAEFDGYHRAHLHGTVCVIIPAMIVELVSGIGWVYQFPQNLWGWISLALLGVIWRITFGMAVPIHNRLARRYSKEDVNELIRVNAFRAAAWVVRGVVLVFIFARFGWTGGGVGS